MHDQFGFTDSFARRLQPATWAEGGLKDEDGIAAACFRFEEFARGFAADFLVRSPEEDEAFVKRCFCLLKRLQREKRLYDAGLHVKGSRAVSFATLQPERHLGEGSGRVNRIVVAQDQELARRAKFARRMSDAEKIAAVLLQDSLRARAVLIPFLGDDATATIGGGFFQAG